MVKAGFAYLVFNTFVSALKPSSASPLIDERVLRRRRTRAARGRGDGFLQVQAAQNAAERILDLNVPLSKSLIIAAPRFIQTLVDIAGAKLQTVIRADYADAPGLNDIYLEGQNLPFANDSFDFVLSGLVLHMENDPQKALMEYARVLKPNGFLLAGLFGGETLSELRAAFYKTEEAFFGKMSPRIVPMIKLQSAANLLQSTPLTMPVVDRDVLRIQYRDLDALIRDLRESGDTNPMVAREKAPLSRGFKSKLAANYQADFSNRDGKLKATFETLWLSAWSPHPDQPKPLKPGSAKMRLADALGVKEHKP